MSKTSNGVPTSKAFKKFHYYFFELEDNPSESLFHIIDPEIIFHLTGDEQKIAEEMLCTALRKNYDRRWAWALSEIGTSTAYQCLLDIFSRTTMTQTKIALARYLVMVNSDAPVMDFIEEIYPSVQSDEVLSVLYWICRGPILETQQDRVLNLLFAIMKDSDSKSRLDSYDLLQQVYGIKDLILSSDPVESLLSSDETESHKKAERLFLERVRSTKFLAVKRGTISDFLKSSLKSSSSHVSSECERCSDIPHHASADMVAGESLKPLLSLLDKLIIFAYYRTCIYRCSTCGQMYYYTYEYEYLVGGSEEDEYLRRIDINEAMKVVDAFLKYYDFKHLIISKSVIKVSY